MIRPGRPGHPRRGTVIQRLRFLEQESDSAATLWTLVTRDMIALRNNDPRQDARLATLTGLTAAIVTLLGAEPGTVGIWLLAMEDDDVDAAAELGADLMEQLLLRHGEPQGEG